MRARRVLALFASLTLALLAGPVAAAAQNTSIPATATFSLSAAGQSSPILNITNLSACSVVVANNGTGQTLVPQASSDAKALQTPSAAQWTTVSAIGGGSITTFGTYTGSTASTGLIAFRVVLTALSSGGPVTGSITCTSAVAGGGGAQVYPIRSQGNFTNTSSVLDTWTTVATPSLTTTTSSGPVGAWLVHVTFVAQIGGGVGSANHSVCIEGTNAGTSGGGDTLLQNTAASNTICNSTVAIPSNPLAGNFGGSAQASLQNIRAEYVAQYPNSTTVSFTCQTLQQGTSGTVGGFCLALAEPI